MRHKRISRRELIKELKEYKHLCDKISYEATSLTFKLESVKEDYRSLSKRFNNIGLMSKEVNVENGMLKVIEVKPIPFGTYAILAYDNMFPVPEYIKRELVQNLAEGLMESMYVKFTKSQPGIGPLNQPAVGAKLYVIPWEQMVNGPKIKLVLSDTNEEKGNESHDG